MRRLIIARVHNARSSRDALSKGEKKGGGCNNVERLWRKSDEQDAWLIQVILSGR